MTARPTGESQERELLCDCGDVFGYERCGVLQCMTCRLIGKSPPERTAEPGDLHALCKTQHLPCNVCNPMEPVAGVTAEQRAYLRAVLVAAAMNALPLLIAELRELKAEVKRVAFPCRQCGKPCEPERYCYATPTCFACLPPPKPLSIAKSGGEPPL